MKRWQLACVFAVLALSLTLASCDAMFESNIFAKIVEREISTATVGGMSTSEVAGLTDSATAMATLSEDPAAKTAVLDKLETVYTTSADPGEVQTASLAAGIVIVETVPEAAAFSGGLVTTMVGFMTDPGSSGSFDMGSTLEALLPADVVAALDQATPPATPPTTFTTIVETFFAANDAYVALNASFAGETLDTIPLSSEQVITATINAVLSYAIAEVQLGADAASGPNDPYDLTTAAGIAALFWDQLTAPSNGVDEFGDPTYPSYITFDTFDTSLIADLGNILGLLGLDALFSPSGV